MKIKFNFKNSKIFNLKTGRLFVFSLKTNLTSFASYSYFLILPTIFFIITYLLQSFFGNYDSSYEYPRIIGLLSVIIITAMIGNSWFISNWLNSIIVKQMKVFKINRNQIYIALFCVSAIMTFISIVFSTVCCLIIDQFLSYKNLTNSIFKIKGFFNIIGIISSLLLMSFICYSISFLISYNIKSIILNQTINIITIIIILSLSDTAFDVNRINNSNVTNAFEMIGYFVPQKSIQWLLFVFCSNLINDNTNLYSIIYNPFVNLPYCFSKNNIVISLNIIIFSVIAWISIFSSINIYLNNKGVKYETKEN